jgi:hypothetical protein
MFGDGTGKCSAYMNFVCFIFAYVVYEIDVYWTVERQAHYGNTQYGHANGVELE